MESNKKRKLEEMVQNNINEENNKRLKQVNI